MDELGGEVSSLPPIRFTVAFDHDKEMYGRASGLPQEPEVATHKSLSPNARSPSPSRRGESGWPCCLCTRTFGTKIGLGVHKRRAHPMTVNADAAPPQVKRRWAEEEVELLARTEARLASVGGSAMNSELMRELPSLGRSLEAIKGYRRKESYKSRVRAYMTEMASSQVPQGAAESPIRGTPSNSAVEGTMPERPSGRVGDASEDGPTSATLQDPMTLSSAPDHAGIVEDLLGEAEARKARGVGGRRGESQRKHKGRTPAMAQAASARLSARKQRRIEYARVQELYKTCRPRAAAEVIDGHSRGIRHSLAELEAYWRPVMEAVSDAPGPTPEVLLALKRIEQYGGARDFSQLWVPFTSEEVKACRVDNASAPGPDGILPGAWNRVPSATQAEIFNAWMMAGEVPERLRGCRTVFVPKTEVPACPGEYRPISIASVPLRHMHSVLARRLEACCPPDARQRGFIRADGTLENSAVLDAVLGDCRKKLRECHVAVLDFAKAFDTVSHTALIEVLRERGLPDGFCNYVARLYATSETVLDVNGTRSGPARVGQGVRQGDPLSPLLFNMAMDAILASLPQGVGYGLESERVSALAYADDLVLLAGSKVGMQTSIDSVWSTGRTMGLFVSHAKSAVLSMVPDGKRKKLHYLSDRTFKVGKRWLRQVTCVERWRYLGVDFRASGCVTLEHDIKNALNNIKKAPLKPQQRLEIVRAHLIPRFLHGLVLGNITDERLKLLDVQIRSAVREWLRLPKDVPVGYFHAGTKDGGLAIPSLRTCVPDLIIKRFGRLNSSRWSVARAAARSERIQRKLRWADRQFLKFSKESPKSGERTTAMYWRETLHASVDGFELRESPRVAASTKWMRERCTQYTGRDFVQFVHTHVNALPSRVRNSRGRREGMLSELNCRAGCMVRETTAHTIQQCHRTHGGRIERHNCIVDVVSSAMVDKGWNVLKEPHIRTSLGLRKPDIVASRNGVGVIVDAQVVSGQRPLDELHREKRSKYGNHDELVEKVAALLDLPCKQSVRATSCTISWRGVWSLGSYKELKSLVGLDEGVFSGIPSLVLRGSHMNWTRFNRMTTRIE